MNGQVYVATPEQVYQWIGREAMSWVEASRPLLVGLYNGECAAVLGAVPISMFSDGAYVWLWTPSPLPVPGIVFARYARTILPKLLELYPELICDCYDPAAACWLRSLGATETVEGLFTFVRKDLE